MCNTFAVYFQIFATFGYKKVKNSETSCPVATYCSPLTKAGANINIIF